jgi:hypothetical protein
MSRCPQTGFTKRVGLLLLAGAVVYGAELTGKWSGTFEELAPDGSVRQTSDAYIDLKLSGQTVTGTAGPSESQQHEISNGRLQGNKLTFEVAGQGPKLKFDLTYDGETIKGAVTGEHDGQRMSARVDLKRRATGPAAADDRADDRAAIRTHIDRIFQAFIHKDRAELRATHAKNWLGYLEGSREMIHGIDEYMNSTGYFEQGSPYGMTAIRCASST